MTSLPGTFTTGSPDERLRALEDLAQGPDADAIVEAAARCLADADRGVRDQAARLLTGAATPAAADRVAPLIASADIAVRNLAGEVLAQIGAPAVDALAPFVDDADHDVRKFAIDVLALLPAGSVGSDVLDRIAARLADDDLNVVLSAVDAVGLLGAAAHADGLTALYAREPLARPNVAAAFGHLRRPSDLALLETALGDEDPSVQFAAAEALAAWDAPEVPALLRRTVATVHPMAQPIVLHALVQHYADAPAGALPDELHGPLVAMLDDPDETYHRAAVTGLRHFSDAATVRALLAHAGRSDATDVEIFEQLTRLAAPAEVVIRTADEAPLTPEVAANFLLGLLAQGALPAEEWDAVAAYLAPRFAALELETKLAAVTLAQRAAHPVLRPLLQAGLADADPEVRAFAVDAAEAAGLAGAAS